MFENMEWKFYPSDVIGKKPKKVGDSFKAEVFSRVATFVVTTMGTGWMMAKMK